ncbi:GNAT family N-acetyltransferase [Enterococcus massiliensis]|uniref:GNAT family N-acetyltransferase n=1 Tax=Enterococcus massiliensis TaxID=1640685 RepID=UPI0028FC8DAE|nr:GNAT family N-acetyltransferase [Enterococcus massiliensis]
MQTKEGFLIFIRPSIPTDKPLLQKIFYDSRKAAFFWEDSAKYQLTDFDQSTQEELVLVAQDQEKICGFISLYLPENFIHNFFVAPEATGQHIGKQLLTAGLARLERPARLKCVSKNQLALAFYLKNGWEKEWETIAPENYWNLIYTKEK